jgi:tetratricopeptide (TPR) repeat protein
MGWLRSSHFVCSEPKSEAMSRVIRISVALAATLLSGVLFGSSTPAQNSSPEDTLRQAMELQRAGDLEGAVQGYRQFLVARPKEAAIQANLGVLLAHLGRFDEAITEYRKAVALDPQNADIVRNLGLAYYKSGRIEEAAHEFTKSHEMAPANLQTILLLADCQLRMGENRGVIELLTPVEAEHSDDLAVAYLLGTALINDGQIREGQKRVDRILSKGDSPEARFLLGNQMFAAGDFPAAVKQLASAIELNPSLPGLQSLYGQALLNTGDPDAAADAFRKELASDPNQFEANLYLAQILRARSRWKDAEPLVRHALRVRPDSLPAALELAAVSEGEGKLAEARRELEVVEKKWPKSAALHQQLAEVDGKLHLTAEAAREKKLAAALTPISTLTKRGPVAGDAAPEFQATRMGTEARVSLGELRNHGPVVVVFGSYTCPNFRSAAETLNKLYPEYKNQIPFYLVYIREAHSTNDWASTRNQREGVVLEPAATMGERQDHATMCVRKLHIEFPTLLDRMDGSAEKAYAAWPSKAYVVDKRGTILFSTGLNEQEFHPGEFEAALRKATTPVRETRLLRGAK